MARCCSSTAHEIRQPVAKSQSAKARGGCESEKGAWLHAHRPRSLVIWGRHDPSFLVDEVAAFRKDVPDAETHVLDAGHFALDDRPDEVARLVDAFLARATCATAP